MTYKKGFRRLFSLLVCLILIVSVFACDSSAQSTADFYAFNTVVHIDSYGEKISEEEKKEIQTLLSFAEETFSASGTGITATFNASAADDLTQTDEAFNEVYEKSYTVYEWSNGKFDATVLPLIKLWQFYPDFPVINFTVPDDDKISAELLKVGFDKTSLTETNGKTFLNKTQDGVSLDFGGAAKGYAADEIAKILKNHGHKKGYVSVGTSSLNLLSVESLSVRHPEKTDGSLLSVNLSNIADVSVSTSGNYEKYYEKNGKRYSHIINPATGYPADAGVLSVTVLCKDCALADCVTTALCLCEHDYNDYKNSELISLIKKFAAKDELKNAIFFAAVSDGNNKQLVTNAEEGSFTLFDETYKTVFIG